jgi:hypothetical protein
MDSKSKILFDGHTAGVGAELIRKLGYEPVWKDWDAALTI